MSRTSSLNGRRRDDLAEFWFEKVAFETKVKALKSLPFAQRKNFLFVFRRSKRCANTPFPKICRRSAGRSPCSSKETLPSIHFDEKLLFLFAFSSKFDVQRIVGIRSLSSLMISDRSETVRRLLPKLKVKFPFELRFDDASFLQNIVEHSVDSEEHAVAAETISTMVENGSLSFNEFINHFASMMCALVFPKTTNRYSTGEISSSVSSSF